MVDQKHVATWTLKNWLKLKGHGNNVVDCEGISNVNEKNVTKLEQTNLMMCIKRITYACRNN